MILCLQHVIVYEGSPKEITEKLVELMGEFHKVVACMFNIQNNCVCVCVCITSNLKMNLMCYQFLLHPKINGILRDKFLNIYVWNLYSEND